MELRQRSNSSTQSCQSLENGEASKVVAKVEQSEVTVTSSSQLKLDLDHIQAQILRIKCIESLQFKTMVVFMIVATFVLASATYSRIQSKDPCDVVKTSLAKLDYQIHRNNGFKPIVPKIIHQQWKDKNIPLGNFMKWHKKWKQIFPEPEYKHILWTDKSGRELIALHYPFFLETYDNYPFNIQRADAMRYFILHRYGGIYADMDYEPLVNFWRFIPQDRVAFVESPFKYTETVQNSFMSSPSHDPFWLSVFTTLQLQEKKPVFYSTGPSLLEEAFQTNREPWHMFPCETFYRISDVTSSKERSPFIAFLKQQTLDRFYPMKYCGDFSNLKCHFGRHHCSASYLKDTGVLALLWNGN